MNRYLYPSIQQLQDKCHRGLPVHISLASAQDNIGKVKGIVPTTQKIQLLYGVITDTQFPIRLTTQSATFHTHSLKKLHPRVILDNSFTIRITFKNKHSLK